MYLLPTQKEMNALWREISPRERFLRAARQAIDEMTRLGDTMSGFYLDSQDLNIMEGELVPYFDNIEDDIINMRRDINGFRMPRGQQRDIDAIDNYSEVDLGEKVEWDEI